MRTLLFIGMAIPCVLARANEAQPDVKLYGVLDVGVEYINNAGDKGGAIIRMQSGGMSTSHVGLRGSEPLGGGMRAFMQLENGFLADTGRAADPRSLFNRQANVGIAWAGGSVLLGRSDSTPGDFLSDDPFGNNYTWSGVSTHLRGGRRDGTLGRVSNLVKYEGRFGAYRLGASYGFGEVAGKPAADAKYASALDYRQAGWGWTLIYDRENSDVLFPGYSRAGNLGLSGSALLGRSKVSAGYRRHLKHGIGRADLRSDFLWLGLALPLAGANTLSFGFYHVDMRNVPDNGGENPRLFAARLRHAMSARTDLYATAGYAWIGNGQPVGVGNNARLYAENGAQVGINLGMRHKF
ncbi:MAG: Outer membrane porin protein 32 [Herbaspirillum frisingense]|uniref:Outer membrane porin protein 32 n=1 Tax=Herbaspirillum frisingense TaxID=92645 RepID=A0A7V8FYP1_9BURK|nr:MAG: Outer membrane porin protein 32 [Herbaspirillum frisingense]